MGHVVAKYITEPDVTPDMDSEPTFDPLFGFPNGRKAREMVATSDEMFSAVIKRQYDDYCAHKLINYFTCINEVFPYNLLCSHQRHEYDVCTHEELVLRMKEYERERRLRRRQKRIEEKRKQLELAA